MRVGSDEGIELLAWDERAVIVARAAGCSKKANRSANACDRRTRGAVEHEVKGVGLHRLCPDRAAHAVSVVDHVVAGVRFYVVVPCPPERRVGAPIGEVLLRRLAMCLHATRRRVVVVRLVLLPINGTSKEWQPAVDQHDAGEAPRMIRRKARYDVGAHRMSDHHGPLGSRVVEHSGEIAKVGVHPVRIR
jgi:hypothetical protein